MALHLNLLHEEIQEQRQRQRDPLKIGVMILAGIGALAVPILRLERLSNSRNKESRSTAVERDWSKVEPKVTAAQKRSQELTGIINTTRVLDD